MQSDNLQSAYEETLKVMPFELREIHEMFVMEEMGTETELQKIFARPDLVELDHAVFQTGEDYGFLNSEDKITVCRLTHEGLRRLQGASPSR